MINEEHLVNLCGSYNYESHTPSSSNTSNNAADSELTRPLFPVESTKQIT